MHNIALDVISVFIMGATSVAFLYHAILFAFSKDKLLIHYLVYLFFTGVFVYIKTGIHAAAFGKASEDAMVFLFRETIQIVYLASYFNFIIHAISVSNLRKPFLFRFWPVTMSVMLAYAAIFPWAKSQFPYADFSPAFTSMRIFIFAITAVMLYQSFRLREIKFQLIILYGCVIYFVFGVISFITNLSDDYSGMLIYPLEWLMIGTFIDIIFFSIAVSYRNRKQYESLNLTLLAEAEKTIALQNVILEKQRELEDERARIAADMHDDLGSGLTKITYLSHAALTHPEPENYLKRIKETAAALVASMSELIWVMKEENNTIEDLATYIKSYAMDYLETNGIACRVSMPDSFPKQSISGNDRRHIFLSVKECLHNIVKHAKAERVSISISLNNGLEIVVHDNGIGICAIGSDGYVSGNGLKNMRNRIARLSGQMTVSAEDGTKVAFAVPLN